MRHVLAACIIAALAAGLVAVTANEFYLRILFSACVYLLCALGMNVLLGYAGQKSLGQAGLFGAGAYSVALLTTSLDMNPWLALVLAVAISAVFGVLIAAPSLRVRGPALAMVTLAFGIVVEKVVTEASDVFGGAMGIYAIKPLTIGGVPLSMAQWVWLGIALCLGIHLLLRNLLTGRFGRAFLSLQADEIAAGAVGVPVLRFKVLAFVIAAATCGLAGALVAQQNQYINSDFITFNLSIFILLVVLFGGSGSLVGPLLGAVTLTLLSAVLARWSWIERFANGALLLFALYAMPKGLAGVLSGVFGKIAGPKAAAEIRPPADVPLPTRPAIVVDGPLLQADDVCKSYGGVRPAHNIGARLMPGDIHALIGPNGAGKSTLINMLSGVVRADAGRIAFLGADLKHATMHAICHRGIARTFQNLRLFRELSVLDNVLLGQHARMSNGFLSSLFGLPRARREEARARQRAGAILDFLGLSHLAEAPAGSLAYGLQRRVELARALATEPRLLLLDEPAAGLNPQETAELGDLLLRVRAQGITILLVEHHMDLVMRISDHVIVLDYGEKISEGTPALVQSDPRVMAAYLGTDVEEMAPASSHAVAGLA
ncbi:amino acid/amide ABC transporter membrane protein 2 (HAAT family) /amino acid/amide ABC transporter ATP-binding protein 1 (HAAT family) [Humitalea rosea]|uniref:Amino acid/amide ABC transporter membrane protein 2 (HAAT family) /amino acid/amide ABC transporter ATP-binding protein 1 (HAAT family) n=1 Tax=Humitalea rosea TaxID=990373 RepID=A0A2W7HWL2_9PROT|nr:branched-chain amino acid ABC transporter ATP-binding protein/permease [Humitalea rosea]PZW37745.1 amino acid/amide ABC transporter membrane protein 2 (HAAT family) /amino acid/amide ABC transporter ATP-binding protein 1 (HAAT family) [Humitalea rosea]